MRAYSGSCQAYKIEFYLSFFLFTELYCEKSLHECQKYGAVNGEVVPYTGKPQLNPEHTYLTTSFHMSDDNHRVIHTYLKAISYKYSDSE